MNNRFFISILLLSLTSTSATAQQWLYERSYDVLKDLTPESITRATLSGQGLFYNKQQNVLMFDGGLPEKFLGADVSVYGFVDSNATDDAEGNKPGQVVNAFETDFYPLSVEEAMHIKDDKKGIHMGSADICDGTIYAPLEDSGNRKYPAIARFSYSQKSSTRFKFTDVSVAFQR